MQTDTIIEPGDYLIEWDVARPLDEVTLRNALDAMGFVNVLLDETSPVVGAMRIRAGQRPRRHGHHVGAVSARSMAPPKAPSKAAPRLALSASRAAAIPITRREPQFLSTAPKTSSPAAPNASRRLANVAITAKAPLFLQKDKKKDRLSSLGPGQGDRKSVV